MAEESAWPPIGGAWPAGAGQARQGLALSEPKMCGIAGIWGRPDEKLIQDIAGQLAHRGPDAEGHFSRPQGTLGQVTPRQMELRLYRHLYHECFPAETDHLVARWRGSGRGCDLRCG